MIFGYLIRVIPISFLRVKLRLTANWAILLKCASMLREAVLFQPAQIAEHSPTNHALKRCP